MSAYNESTEFDDDYTLTMQWNTFEGLRSLFVPNSVQTELKRVLRQNYDTPYDALSVGANLGWQAINMFGSLGAVPVFKFYSTDQLSWGGGFDLAFPKGEDVQWSWNANTALTFIRNEGGQAALSATFNQTPDSATGSASFALTLPAPHNLLGTIYSWAVRKLDAVFTSSSASGKVRTSSPFLESVSGDKAERLIRETFDWTYTLDNDDNHVSTYSLKHESIVRVRQKMNLTSFASLSLQDASEDKALTFMVQIGITMNVIF